jgi:hypothetical protein
LDPIDLITVSAYHSFMRTTLTLADDIFEAAQAQARASGQRLGEVVSDLARRGLRSDSKRSSKRAHPVFKVSANAPIIPSSRAKELLADEP